jgi:hypothetical protein
VKLAPVSEGETNQLLDPAENGGQRRSRGQSEGKLRGPLTAAADERPRRPRTLRSAPAARHAGHELRRASRLLLTARVVTHGDTRQLLELLARMIAFTEAVARLRETQHRAAQAAGARCAAEQLQHCRLMYAGPAVDALPAADASRRRHTAAATTAATAIRRT